MICRSEMPYRNTQKNIPNKVQINFANNIFISHNAQNFSLNVSPNFAPNVDFNAAPNVVNNFDLNTIPNVVSDFALICSK